jgi:hypothetical protein
MLVIPIPSEDLHMQSFIAKTFCNTAVTHSAFTLQLGFFPGIPFTPNSYMHLDFQPQGFTFDYWLPKVTEVKTHFTSSPTRTVDLVCGGLRA